MPILIDGYNLLYAANIVADGPGVYSFEKSRQALLRWLLSVLSVAEVAETTVVFDGREAPLGLPKQLVVEGITVLFSQPGSEADDLIEQLLPTYSAPKRLTVVSSDHRVQRAAKRRKAVAVDSEVWHRQRITARRPSAGSASAQAEQFDGDFKLTQEEITHWLAAFGDEPIDTDKSPFPTDDGNPFPEGYGEDLL